MAIPSEVRKTIAAIDLKIKDLEETKKRLSDTFGGSLPAARTNGNRPQAALSVSVADSIRETSSSEKLANFLREHGPATRREIYEHSGIPSGSVSYLLKSAKFRQRPDEKWEIAA